MWLLLSAKQPDLTPFFPFPLETEKTPGGLGFFFLSFGLSPFFPCAKIVFRKKWSFTFFF